jgi:hypothetical protein
MRYPMEIKGKAIGWLGSLWMLISFSVQAQNTDEWLRPKETQLEYLVIQVAGLKLNTELISKASKLMELGLEGINSWKDLEKSLHGEFFDSHRKLGPLAQGNLSDLEGEGLVPDELGKEILDSRIYWEKQIPVSDQVFALWSGEVHQGMLLVSVKLESVWNILRSPDLEMEDSERSIRIKNLEKELINLRNDLIRVQILSNERLELNRERRLIIHLQKYKLP